MFSNQLNNCKNFEDLSSTPKNSTNLIDSLRFTTLSKNKVKECGYLIDLSEIIGHHLNLSFVKPNQDFDGSLGWYNGTHSSGPMKMIAENQVDFILSEIPNEFLTKNMWNPNLYQLSTGLVDDYTMNLALRKQTIKTSISDYFKTFNWSTWFFIFSSIFLVSMVQAFIHNFNSEIRFNYNLFNKLSKEHITMLLGQSSNVLKKLIPRHYLMYFIPILSVLLITLFQNIIYLNMIVPRKHWCQDLDCFAKSKIDFHAASDDPALIELKQKKEWQFKMILSRLTTIKPRSIVSKLID